MYILLLAVIYLAFISLGLPDSLLGSAWPVIREEFGVPLSYMGLVSMMISLCSVISGLVSARVTKKFGTRAVTVVSVFLTAAALLGFSTTGQLYQMCLWAIPYGLGAGAIDAALNNYVATHYRAKHMNWLHCFWGVGTVVGPYVMSWAITQGAWRTGYRIISCLQFGIGAVLLLSLPLWNIHKRQDQAQESTRVLGLKAALKRKGVPYALLSMFCYCAAEATVMSWASSYMEGVLGVDKSQAAALACLVFIGITAGRLLAGFLSDRLGDRKMIWLGTGIALFGILCIAAPLGPVAMAGFLIVGLGCAPIYPCIVHSTPATFGAENSQSIIGLQMASAYVGVTFMPPLFGLLASFTGLRLMPVYLLLFFGLMILTVIKSKPSQLGTAEA